MRFSKKRKLVGIRTKPVNVVVSEEAREKLDRIAGRASLGSTIETLIEREYSRRERKAVTLQVQNNACAETGNNLI